MSKCRIIIVRHAQTIGNVENRLTGESDYEITSEGKRHIQLLTRELKNIKFDKIYSSTSSRAEKTIEQLAKINNKDIIKLESLKEMYFGIYDGWKWEDVNKINPNIKATQVRINEIVGIPKQEDMKELANRMYNVITEIAENNIGKNVLICSHGVAIEAFLRKIEKIPFKEQREKFCQHNTAINEIEYENGGFKVLKLAYMKHVSNKII